MLLQKFLSRKKLSRKYRSIFGLKNQSCDRRYGRSGNEICAEEGQNPIFDPLPRNEKLCGNL